MITIEEFMKTIGYRLTEGSDYGWKCYGPNAYSLSSWNGVHGAGGWSANIVFSTKSQKVYEVDVCDYTNNRAYRLINPKYKDRHDAEAANRSELANQAWDNVNYIDLEIEGDWLEKTRAIVAGEDYDTRVQMSVEFSDEEALRYMKAAHELDITFNQFIERALREAMLLHKNKDVG
jgi:hypothetical protein